MATLNMFVTVLLATACLLVRFSSAESWADTGPVTKHDPTEGYGKGFMCKDHLLKKHYPYVTGEILRSWVFRKNDEGSQQWFNSAYRPRHNFKLENNGGTPKMYENLDHFGIFNGLRSYKDWATVHFQRKAKVYLYVNSWDGPEKKPSLSGWTSEGYVKALSDDRQKWTAGGIGTESKEYTVLLRGFMFSKVVDETVVLPTRQYIAANVRNLKTDGFYNVFFAEADGSPTQVPQKPNQFRDIQPGQKCPEKLHNWWRLPGDDTTDPFIKGRLFKTWHPLWDPCFWCTYAHEHGSSAPMIMDYWPRYDYTALKNFNQDEAHEGFKDYVFDGPQYYIYYGTHAHVSDYGRFYTRFHTNCFVARKKSTWEIELNVCFKSDYGSLLVRDKDRNKVGVTDEEEELREEIGVPRRMRIVNVLNHGQLSPKFLYRPKNILLTGLYEQWATSPICATTTNYKEPTVDIKDPLTAMKKPYFPDCGAKCNTQILGFGDGDQFVPSASVNREFRVTKMMFDVEACEFSNVENFKGGVFYTNPYANVTVDGPGRTHIRQYIKEGFSYPMDGFYNTLDVWQGLYQKGAFGHFRNVAYGIDQFIN